MHKPITLRQSLLALVLFGIAFGYVEAAVVVYLRELSQPALTHADPARSSEALFPTLTMAQVKSYPNLWHTLEIELGREAATLVMLAAFALAMGRDRVEAAGAFVMAFGIWDISFYGFLRLFIHWPSSLLTWDLLFLLPVPWAGPVLAPVIVSLTMILAGFLVLWRGSKHQPVILSYRHWLGILLGGLIIVLSFTWNFSNLMAGGIPGHFNWPLFAMGEAISLGTFLAAAAKSKFNAGTGRAWF